MQAQQNAGISTVAGMLLRGGRGRRARARHRNHGRRRHGWSWNSLKFSRTQEQAADQAAVTYLRSLQMSPEGLLDFFHVLENQNLRILSDGSEYLRTHPLTRDRINFLSSRPHSRPIATPSPIRR